MYAKMYARRVRDSKRVVPSEGGGHTFISIWPQKIIIRPCTGVFFNKRFLHIHVFFLTYKRILQIKIFYTIHSLLAKQRKQRDGLFCSEYK